MGILIGIGGISRAGKSKLSEYLQQHISNAEVIHQDNFVKPKHEIPTVRGRVDWEHPDSINWTTLAKEIDKSLETHSYTLLEGLFAFYHKEIESRMSLKIHLSLDKQRFLDLKKIDERWGEEPDWFIEHIWQSYLLYGQVNDKKNLSSIHNISDSNYHLIKMQIQNL
jgi:uridine kinase